MAKKKARKRSKKKPEPREPEAGVSINLPERPLAHADAIFVVRKKGQKFGELRISKGGLDWYPRYGKKARSVRWAKFAALMESA